MIRLGTACFMSFFIHLFYINFNFLNLLYYTFFYKILLLAYKISFQKPGHIKAYASQTFWKGLQQNSTCAKNFQNNVAHDNAFQKYFYFV